MVIFLGMENIKILYEIKNGHTIKSANVVWKVCSWGNSTKRCGSGVTFKTNNQTNNRSQCLIEMQYIHLTPMMYDTPPMLEELISKHTSLKYSPINNKINNIKIIVFNIKS